MEPLIYLISEDPQDLRFAQEVAKESGLELRPYPNALTAAKDIQQNVSTGQQPVLFADISSAERLESFRGSFSDLIGSSRGKIDPNLVHLITQDSGPQLREVNSMRLFGHLVFRNFKEPEQIGRQYGRVVRATSLQRKGFGIRSLLGAEAHYAPVPMSTSSERSQALGKIGEALEAQGVAPRMIAFLTNAADELLMNAIYDAPAAAAHVADAVARTTEIELSGKRAVVVELGVSAEAIGLTVADQFGSLDRTKLFEHLLTSYKDRDYKVDPNAAGAGLGLAITLNSGGSLVFVTEKGVLTEVTLLVKRTDSWKEFRQQCRFVSVHIEP